MAKAKKPNDAASPSGGLVRVRVLADVHVDGTLHRSNTVADLQPETARALADLGAVDADPLAVSYVESLTE